MRSIKLLFILLFVCLLAGCAKTTTISFKHYRGKPAAEIYHSAQMAMAKGNYQNAVKDLQALDTIYPFGPYARQGELDIIYAYYKNGSRISALAAADRYIRLYPRGPHVDYAYYLKGLVDFDLGMDWAQRIFHVNPASLNVANKKEAFAAFNHVVSYYPHSPYASDAALRMAYIRNLIAEHNLLIAEFYFKRKGYVAAANRASIVLRHYEGSPEVIPALALMVKSYRRLGLTDMADKTMAIFRASYPHSPEYLALTKTKTKKV